MPSQPSSPRRVLHVVHTMDRGGTETWLRNVMRHVDPRRVRMDFAVHTDEPGAYDDDVRRSGARVIVCPGFERPIAYVARMRRLLASEGPYDVVHAHVYLYSGFALLAARLAGVPRRIVHAHTAKVEPGDLRRRAYQAAMRRLIRATATHGYAVSVEAGRNFFGGGWGKDARWQPMYCGIDLEPFRVEPDRRAVRAAIGIPSDALVLVHVGRMSAEKNHRFLLEVVAAARRQGAGIAALLVGDGPMRAELEARAAFLGVSDRVVFAGVRSDVPALLRASDVFVFPSTYEGLPLAVVEAQAAGLPAVISSAVTREVALVPGRVTSLSLDESSDRWAAVVIEKAREGPAGPDAASCLAGGPFDIRTSAAELERAYAA